MGKAVCFFVGILQEFYITSHLLTNGILVGKSGWQRKFQVRRGQSHLLFGLEFLNNSTLNLVCWQLSKGQKHSSNISRNSDRKIRWFRLKVWKTVTHPSGDPPRGVSWIMVWNIKNKTGLVTLFWQGQPD